MLTTLMVAMKLAMICVSVASVILVCGVCTVLLRLLWDFWKEEL